MLILVSRYSDHSCDNYIDTTYFSGIGIHGNTQGAGSALFVTTDGCSSMTQHPIDGFFSRSAPKSKLCFVSWLKRFWQFTSATRQRADALRPRPINVVRTLMGRMCHVSTILVSWVKRCI